MPPRVCVRGRECHPGWLAPPSTIGPARPARVYGQSPPRRPPLVGIDHQLVGPPNLFAHQPAAPQIVLRVSPHLQFEAGPALRQRLPAKRTNLLVTEAVPADGGRIRGVSLAPQQAQPFSLATLRFLEDLASLPLRKRIVDIANLNRREYLLRLQLRQQLP